MNKLVLSIAIGLISSTAIVGCGGSGQPQNVAADADAQAIADYERMVAEEEAKANSQDTKAQ